MSDKSKLFLVRSIKEKNVQEWWDKQCKLLGILKRDTVMFRQEVIKPNSIFKIRYKGKYIAQLTINPLTGEVIPD